MNRIRTETRVTALLIMLTALFCLGGCIAEKASTCNPLTVTLLRVGKADAIVAISGTHALLIDTGEEEDGLEVAEFLEKQGITEIDTLIITHFDKDHVGGADTVLEQFPVKTVYVPDYHGTHMEYRDFLRTAEGMSVQIQRLTKSASFSFGDAQILVEPPSSYEIPDNAVDFDNNFSLITTIQHGNNRLIFMGDAEKKRIRQWLAESQPEACDFLKVPHHGIYNKALDKLFETLSPRYAVICSSQNNPAEDKTLELLKVYCPHVFETKDGNVTVLSNGTWLKVEQKK